MTKIRLLKPSIPRIGYYGLPIRDEIEMAKPLIPRPSLASDDDRTAGRRDAGDDSPPDSFAGLFTAAKVIGGLTSRKPAR